MELHLSIFMMSLILFVGVLSGSIKSVTPDETYWNKVLPNTPMPAALKSSLQSIGNHGKTSPFLVSGTPNAFARYVFHRYRAFLHYQPPTIPTGNDDDFIKKYEQTIMLETQLVPGRTIEVPFTSTTNEAEYKATFLPRKVGDSIPFSSNKLPEILDRFSVRPKSKEAMAIENTIRECQDAKDKAYCATSLEGMVSFVTSELRDESVNAFSSTPTRKTNISSSDHDSDGKKEYKMKISGVKQVSDYGPIVACHKQDYPYAVFYCHRANKAAAYMVTLTGNQKKLAVCHKDTSWWDPNHIAFQVLKVKPGITVCHFLSDLAVVWTHKY